MNSTMDIATARSNPRSLALFALLIAIAAAATMWSDRSAPDAPSGAVTSASSRDAASADFAARGAAIEANKAAARSRGGEDAAGTTDFPALLTTTVDVVGDGRYVFYAGPVDASMQLPNSYAFDFPKDLDFRFVRTSFPRKVMRDGATYLEISFSAVGVTAPYNGFRVWIS